MRRERCPIRSGMTEGSVSFQHIIHIIWFKFNQIWNGMLDITLCNREYAL